MAAQCGLSSRCLPFGKDQRLYFPVRARPAVHEQCFSIRSPLPDTEQGTETQAKASDQKQGQQEKLFT